MQTTCRLFTTQRETASASNREGTHVTEEIQKNKGISRRTIVKGAAWSVPVIAAAVATPLAAASLVNDDLVPALSVRSR